MMSGLRESIPLKRRKIIKKSIGRFARTLPAAIILTIVVVYLYSLVSEGSGRIAHNFAAKQEEFALYWLVAMAAWLLWEPFYQYLYFINYFYDMDENNVIIRKGVIVKKEIILPFSKITDVYVDQDPMDVALAIYDVHISTPTVESGKFAHIDGVSRKGATELRGMILEKINNVEKD